MHSYTLFMCIHIPVWWVLQVGGVCVCFCCCFIGRGWGVRQNTIHVLKKEQVYWRSKVCLLLEKCHTFENAQGNDDTNQINYLPAFCGMIHKVSITFYVPQILRVKCFKYFCPCLQRNSRICVCEAEAMVTQDQGLIFWMALLLSLVSSVLYLFWFSSLW